jgi:hypothetical protein
MEDLRETDGAAYFRDVADRLRAIARPLLDLRRKAQLNALADGFERYADRIEGEQTTVRQG